jgi:division protein CdvB (Snf7/Vps24/ESCRT-III family)
MNRSPQLKSKLNNANTIVNNQLAKLRILDNRFNRMDKDLHDKVIANLKNGNTIRAKALANELAHFRKIKDTTKKLLLSLEVTVIRFSTISEFSEVLDTINPMIETIKEVKDDIKNTIPTATNIVSEMSTLTSSILIHSNLDLNLDILSVPINSDALEILSEVQNIIEDETKSKLPEIPKSITNITNKSKPSIKNKEIYDINSEITLEA